MVYWYNTNTFIPTNSSALFSSFRCIHFKPSCRNLNAQFPVGQFIKIILYLGVECSCRIMFCFCNLINDRLLSLQKISEVKIINRNRKHQNICNSRDLISIQYSDEVFEEGSVSCVCYDDKIRW